MFQVNVVEEIETRLLCAVTFLENRAVYEIMWKNTVDPGRPQMTIWRKRIACRITKATRARAHTHTHTLSLSLAHARTHTRARARTHSLSLSVTHTHTHTHTQYLILRSSAASVVARTRLNVTLYVHCLCCYYKMA